MNILLKFEEVYKRFNEVTTTESINILKKVIYMNNLSKSLVKLFLSIIQNGYHAIDFDKNCNSNIIYVLDTISCIEQYERKNKLFGISNHFKKVASMICEMESKSILKKEVKFFKQNCNEVFVFFKHLLKWRFDSKHKDYKKFISFCDESFNHFSKKMDKFN